jgi:hypothetical protein
LWTRITVGRTLAQPRLGVKKNRLGCRDSIEITSSNLLRNVVSFGQFVPKRQILAVIDVESGQQQDVRLRVGLPPDAWRGVQIDARSVVGTKRQARRSRRLKVAPARQERSVVWRSSSTGRRRFWWPAAAPRCAAGGRTVSLSQLHSAFTPRLRRLSKAPLRSRGSVYSSRLFRKSAIALCLLPAFS